MPGIFKTPFSYTGTGPADLLEALAPSANHLIFLGFTIFQTSDFGDAQEEGQKIYLETGNTSAGTGGAAITPEPTATDGGAATFTAQNQCTVAASGGTAKVKGRWGWNVRMEKEKMLSEAEQIKVAAGTRAVLRLKGTSPDSLTIEGEALWQEF